MGCVYLPVFAADESTTTEEATLTIREFTVEEDGTRTFAETPVLEEHGGFNTLLTKIKTVMDNSDNAEKFYDYTVTLHKTDVSFTAKTYVAKNVNTYININLNGNNIIFAQDANIFTMQGGAKLTIDGGNSEGERGRLTNSGKAGSIVYTTAPSAVKDGDVVTNQWLIDNCKEATTTILNLEYYASDMSAAYSNNSQWGDQPMSHIKFGDATFKNVKMVYTGAKATFTRDSYMGKQTTGTNSDGSPIYKYPDLTDLSTLNMRLINFYASGKAIIIEDCEIIDTNENPLMKQHNAANGTNKRINTIGIFIENAAKVVIKNTTSNANKALQISNLKIDTQNAANNVVNAINCDFTSAGAIQAGNGVVNFYDCELTTGNGVIANGGNAYATLYTTGGTENEKTVVYSSVTPKNYTAGTGFALTQKNAGCYELASNGTQEATYFAYKSDSSFIYGATSFNNAVSKASEISTEKTTFTVNLLKNANIGVKSLTLNPDFNLHIKLNGYTLTAVSAGNHLTVAGGAKIVFDGGVNSDGTNGKIISDLEAGAIFYIQTTNTSRPNQAQTFVEIKNLDMHYSGLNAGYNREVIIEGSNYYAKKGDGTKGGQVYPGQPMLNIQAGDGRLYNVNMIYTGTTAAEQMVAGSASANGLTTEFTTKLVYIAGGGNWSIENTKVLDTNTYGMIISAFELGNGKFYFKKSEVAGFYGLSTSATATVEVHDSIISGVNASGAEAYAFKGSGSVLVFNSVVKSTQYGVGNSTAANIVFIYGQGTNRIECEVAPKAAFAQLGYTFEEVEPGVWMMAENTSYEATIVIFRQDSKPIYKAGSYYNMMKYVSQYQVDSSGNVIYEKDLDGNYVLDSNGKKIPIPDLVDREYYLVLNKDVTHSSNPMSANEHMKIHIDYNGHTVTAGKQREELPTGAQNYKSKFNSNIYQLSGNFYLSIDGADRDGNLGSLICHGVAGAIVYVKSSGTTNSNTVIDISNLNMTYTDLSSCYSTPTSGYWPSQQLLHIQDGTTTMTNVHMVYTGENASAFGDSTIFAGDEFSESLKAGTELYTGNDPAILAQLDAKLKDKMTVPMITVSTKANLTMTGCSLTDTNTKGIVVQGINISGTGDVNITDSDFVNISTRAIHSSSTGNVSVTGGTVSSRLYCYYVSNKPIVVTDVETIVTKYLTGNTAGVTFMYGSGNTSVRYVNGGAISGTFTIESGYGFFKTGDKYVVSDGVGFSSVMLPAIFANGMVFQREKPINIYGTCKLDGAEVKVTLSNASGVINEKIVTVANKSWMATFAPMAAQKGLSVKVQQMTGVDSEEVPTVFSYGNIDVGEVWVNVGQSNADYELYKMEDAEEYINTANEYNIKAYIANKNTSIAEDKIGSGGWYDVTADAIANKAPTYGDIPAIAYVMARRIADEVGPDVTVAIIHTPYAGSSIKTWISEEYYPTSDYLSVNEPAQIAEYKAFYDKYGRMPTTSTSNSNYEADRAEFTGAGWLPKPYQQLPMGNYNAMMASMEGYEVKGVVWYQGCADSGHEYKYIPYFEAVKNTFRDAFCDAELPIAVIQLAPRTDGGTDFHAAQYQMTADDPNCYLVSSFTEGSVFEQSDYDNNAYDGNVFTHPSRKSPIGHRLADLVLEKIYGLATEVAAPEVTNVTASGNALTVTFDQDMFAELDRAPEGFEIAGSDGVFYKADAVINGNKIILTSSNVSSPVSVRYGYGSIIVEFRDGTIIPWTSSCKFNIGSTTLVAPDGTIYTVTPKNNPVLRTKYNGNVYGKSGHPMAVFKLDVGYEPAKSASVSLLNSGTACTHSYLSDIDSTCENCGEARAITALKTEQIALKLYDDISISFRLSKANYEALGFTGVPKLTVEFLGNTYTLSAVLADGYYVFSTPRMSPHLIGEIVKYTLKTADGIYGETSETSILAYCQKAMASDKVTTVDKALIVDMLNYATAAQKYVGHMTEGFANEFLTPEQAALGIQTAPVITRTQKHNKLSDSIYFTSASVNLNGNGIGLKFKAEATENIKVIVTNEDGQTVATITSFEKDVQNYAVFRGASAAQLREKYTFALYNGNELCDELVYSFEGYAYNVLNAETASPELLIDLVNAMINYGDSAVNYLNNANKAELIYQLKADGTYEVIGWRGDNTVIIIPSTYDGKAVTSVNAFAFAGNTNITAVVIPSSVKAIEHKAFFGCTSLKDVALGSSVETIGDYAFAGTAVRDIIISDSVVSIGYGAFSGIEKLEEVTLPFIGGSDGSSNEHIGFIFGAPSFMANGIKLPTSLEKVTLSDTCTFVPAFAFYGCENLTEINLGKIDTIGISAFYGCDSLGKIYIPSTVKEIYADAYQHNSPFVGMADSFKIVTEEITAPSNYGQYWNYTAEDKKVTVSSGNTKYQFEKTEDMTSASLVGIYINGTAVSGFASDKYNYTANTDINLGYSGTEITFTLESLASSVEITPASKENGGVVAIKVTSGNGNTVNTYNITLELAGTYVPKAEVVNKGGADGVVTFVIDDYTEPTAVFAQSMINKYSYLKLSMAVPLSNFATLKKTDDGKAYLMSNDGKYIYEKNEAQWTVYNNLLLADPNRVEIINHTYSHSFWGLDDEGGVYTYINNSNQVITSPYIPAGSATAQILASKQILEELFPDNRMFQSALSYVEAGIGVPMSNKTYNGVTYPTYYTYYKTVLQQAYANGDIIGSRSTTTKVNLAANLATEAGRMSVGAYMVRGTEDVSLWTDYIDQAIAQNGWACFCIHTITKAATNGHYILEPNAEALFTYVDGKNVWMANYTEAMLYYSEWSTAKLDTDFVDGEIKVTLTDSERDDIYNQELTVKVSVPANWDNAFIGDKELDIRTNDDGSTYVYVDILPDSGTVSIVTK